MMSDFATFERDADAQNFSRHPNDAVRLVGSRVWGRLRPRPRFLLGRSFRGPCIEDLRDGGRRGRSRYGSDVGGLWVAEGEASKASQHLRRVPYGSGAARRLRVGSGHSVVVEAAPAQRSSLLRGLDDHLFSAGRPGRFSHPLWGWDTSAGRTREAISESHLYVRTDRQMVVCSEGPGRPFRFQRGGRVRPVFRNVDTAGLLPLTTYGLNVRNGSGTVEGIGSESGRSQAQTAKLNVVFPALSE